MLLLLLGSGAMVAAALTSLQSGQSFDAGRTLVMASGGVLAGLGGFKVGRMMAAGQLFGSRVCRSCNAKRRTAGAFCETCHRRD